MREPTDAQIEAARRAAYKCGINDPYMARSRDYPDLNDLRAADAEAERQNAEAWREVLRAALDA